MAKINLEEVQSVIDTLIDDLSKESDLDKEEIDEIPAEDLIEYLQPIIDKYGKIADRNQKVRREIRTMAIDYLISLGYNGNHEWDQGRVYSIKRS